MKKYLLGIIMLFFLNQSSNAQIVYIDLNSILNNSNVGKSLNTHLKKIRDEYLNKFNKIEKSLIDKEKQLLSQKNIIDKNEFDSKLEKLSIEVKKYRSEKKLSQDNLNEVKIKNSKKIIEYLNPIITEYVDTNSISLVIPKKNIIVGKKNLDITDEIIKILNNKVNSLNF
tara:strand:+ start:5452 stop:5961 length:510 start_codon:yes stop_codon:yes gene_type:complete